METFDDFKYMRRTLELAHTGADAGEVPVGALITNADGFIIAEAHNAPIRLRDPTAHAEILAIREAAILLNNYRLSGCTLYVSLEPCAMCAGAIANARLDRIVFAAPDTKGGAVINGPCYFDLPTCHWRPEVSHGLLSDESSELLRSFFQKKRTEQKSLKEPDR